MNIQFKGEITNIKPARSFDSGSKSRTFWAKELPDPSKEHDYPQELEFEIFSSSKAKSDMTAVLDDITVGSTVSFSFSPRGNKWTNPKTNEERLFTSFRVVSKIEVESKGSSAPAPVDEAPDFADTDDIPF